MTTSASTTTFQGGTGSQIDGISCDIEKKGIFIVITVSLFSDNSSLDDAAKLRIAITECRGALLVSHAWTADRKFTPDIFSQTLCFGR